MSSISLDAFFAATTLFLNSKVFFGFLPSLVEVLVKPLLELGFVENSFVFNGTMAFSEDDSGKRKRKNLRLL